MPREFNSFPIDYNSYNIKSHSRKNPLILTLPVNEFIGKFLLQTYGNPTKRVEAYVIVLGTGYKPDLNFLSQDIRDIIQYKEKDFMQL